MRAKIIFGFMAIVTACACKSGPKDYDEHLERLISAVPAQSLEYKDQWLLEYGDFTGDGEDELLAFVYEETGRYEEIVNGQYYLYYSTRNALTVCDTLYANFYKPPVMMDAGGSTILFYTVGYGGPTGESFCWKCDEDGLVPVPMPGQLGIRQFPGRRRRKSILARKMLLQLLLFLRRRTIPGIWRQGIDGGPVLRYSGWSGTVERTQGGRP